MKKFYAFGCTVMLVGMVGSAQAALITDENFENGASGWSDNTTTVGNETFTTFLGRFGNSDGTQTTYKDYVLSGQQTDVTISFDFYEIDSWDSTVIYDPATGAASNEYFAVFLDNQLSRSDYYDYRYVESPEDTTPLFDGNIGFWSRYPDQGVRYSFTYATDTTSLRLGFGANLNQDISDESWGIDNVLITSNYNPTSSEVPEPATLALFGAGLIGLGAVRRRRNRR